LIWGEAQRAPHFIVGSSGVGYALAAHWRQSGLIPSERAAFPRIEPREQILVMSGSASPLTAQQIAWAAQHGFDTYRAAAPELVQAGRAAQVSRNLIDRALASLSQGKSVLIYSAAGPDDASIAATRDRVSSRDSTAKLLGGAMGRIAREILARTALRRVVIAGGDTSSYAVQELGLYALEMKVELTPGAPLCRAHSDDARIDGLEIALKGGQMGKVDYFGLARGD
jgi:uncharacterized protein YgbK (DUF1537 family)